MNRKLRLLLFTAILAGAGAALQVAAIRSRVESRMRVVEIIVDWSQIQDLSAQSGIPPAAFLLRLRAHGVRGIAVSEDVVSDLRDNGFLDVEADPLPDGGIRTIVSSFDPALLNRVRENLRRKMNLRRPLPLMETSGGRTAFVWNGSFETLRPLSVGLPPGEVAMLREAGFDVVARIGNFRAADAGGIEWSLRGLKRMGIRKVIFGGEEVLGYRAGIKETARILRREGLTYGSVEFGRQRGDETLSTLLEGEYLRVHSISPVEMTRLQPQEMIERYSRAAEERNIRIAFVRFLPYATENGLDDQIDYLDGITRGIRATGLSIGETESPAPINLFAPLRWVIGIGAAAALVLLLVLLTPADEGLCFVLFGGLALLHVGLIAGTEDIGRKIIALESSVLFPTFSMIALYGFLRRRLREERPFRPLLAYAATAGVSLLGGLYTVGLLSSLPYMMKARQFAGIKAAHLLPLLLLTAVMGLDLVADHRTRHEMIESARQRVRRMLAQPILIGQVIVVGVVLLALVVLMLRTGNDPGVGVSGMEMRIRALLDRILFVRPRTKEFLVGHPALFLALAWAARSIRVKAGAAPRWPLTRSTLVFLLLIAAVGQVSLVNTFAHLHTPLVISVLRAVIGWAVGGVIGAIFFRLLVRRDGVANSDRANP